MGNTPLTLDADATSLSSAQANVAASSATMALNLNNNLKNLYNGAFGNWSISVRAGRISNDNPPPVPKSFIVVPDREGWAFPVQAGPPVCDPLPVPEDPNKQPGTPGTLTANTIDIGRSLGGAWYVAGPLDTWPPNKKTPPVPMPDGSVHQFMKIPAPVGTQQVILSDGTVVSHGGWYEAVS